MKLALLIVFLFPIISFAQKEPMTDEEIASHFFMPSIEMGYIHNFTDALSGGVIVNTSLEYRIRNNNDVFFRANYDTYTADYELKQENGLTSVIKGTGSFSDFLLGAGYRFGDNKFRSFVMLQAGATRYNFPTLVVDEDVISIEQSGKLLFSSRATVGFEYYFTEKSAFAIDLFQNQIWERQDFWQNSGSAVGISFGFIASLS